MIINIDHIAYAASNIQNSIQGFIQQGYHLEFCEILPNLKIKEQFLTNYNKTHELSLLTSTNGYNIEILNHGEISKNNGYIELKTNNEIIIATDNIEKSKDFWTKIGFKFENNKSAVFSSILSKNKNLRINLEQRDINYDFKINDKGYNCIGFITTSIEKDIEKFKQSDCKISEIESLNVNSKPMKICFIQRANCEIIELIEIER